MNALSSFLNKLKGLLAISEVKKTLKKNLFEGSRVTLDEEGSNWETRAQVAIGNSR